MRILVLAPHPFYQDRGTPIDVDLLLRGLSARGECVDVVTYHEGQDVSYPGVVIHRIPAYRYLSGVRPGFSIQKVLCDLLLLQLAWRLMRRNRYDLLHAGEEAVFIAMLIQFAFRIPYVYDMDSSLAQQMVESMPYLKWFSPLFNWFERVAIRRSIAVAPVCPALADLAHSRGAGDVVTLHDISQLDPQEAQVPWFLRKKLGIDGTMVMYVGNLEPYQGVDLLLESLVIARRRANIDVVIAGGTPDTIAAYQQLAGRLGVAPFVHFIGPWPMNRLGQLLAEADVLVAPRIRGINTPMKIFAYLHSGRPVLATNLPTHTQVLDDRIAMLAPADPEGFAKAMVRLANSPPLRQRLGRAGKSFVESRHTYVHYEKRLNRLYDLVTVRCQRSRPAALQTA